MNIWNEQQVAYCLWLLVPELLHSIGSLGLILFFTFWYPDHKLVQTRLALSPACVHWGSSHLGPHHGVYQCREGIIPTGLEECTTHPDAQFSVWERYKRIGRWRPGRERELNGSKWIAGRGGGDRSEAINVVF